jgi:toxin YhaV
MEVNGWRLFQYPLFENQLKRLTEAVEQLSISKPDTYKEHPKAKLLATIHRHVTEIIPRDPNAPEFRQGDTLGPDNRHWFREKFHQRYRLFFRFSSKDRVIVYVWVNDEFTLRKAGSKTDAYAVFKSMLTAGNPPRTFEDLLKHAKEMRGEAKISKDFPDKKD